jgi:catechol 2,3-dioxygenase-like lactoylglutathione lyase family enzyme
MGGMTLELFAGIKVRDYAAAVAWYSKLLGEPAFEPHDRETVWELAAGRLVYVVEDETAGGSGTLTGICEDLDARVAAIGGRGLEPDEVETYSNGVRKALFRDPEGNEIGFGEVPA